jgi:hypothetical protein
MARSKAQHTSKKHWRKGAPKTDGSDDPIKKIYVVLRGRRPGLHPNYAAVQVETDRFPGQAQKSFLNLEEALDLLEENLTDDEWADYRTCPVEINQLIELRAHRRAAEDSAAATAAAKAAAKSTPTPTTKNRERAHEAKANVPATNQDDLRRGALNRRNRSGCLKPPQPALLPVPQRVGGDSYLPANYGHSDQYLQDTQQALEAVVPPPSPSSTIAPTSWQYGLLQLITELQDEINDISDNIYNLEDAEEPDEITTADRRKIVLCMFRYTLNSRLSSIQDTAKRLVHLNSTEHPRLIVADLKDDVNLLQHQLAEQTGRTYDQWRETEAVILSRRNLIEGFQVDTDDYQAQIQELAGQLRKQGAELTTAQQALVRLELHIRTAHFERDHSRRKLQSLTAESAKRITDLEQELAATKSKININDSVESVELLSPPPVHAHLLPRQRPTTYSASTSFDRPHPFLPDFRVTDSSSAAALPLRTKRKCDEDLSKESSSKKAKKGDLTAVKEITGRELQQIHDEAQKETEAFLQECLKGSPTFDTTSLDLARISPVRSAPKKDTEDPTSTSRDLSTSSLDDATARNTTANASTRAQHRRRGSTQSRSSRRGSRDLRARSLNDDAGNLTDTQPDPRRRLRARGTAEKPRFSPSAYQ